MDQDESSLHCYASAEEPLSPIIRMERFMLSDIIVNRWVREVQHVWVKLSSFCEFVVFSMLSEIHNVTFSDLSIGKWLLDVVKTLLGQVRPKKKFIMC